MNAPLPKGAVKIRLTPDGALAAAFSNLCQEADLGRAWWTKSPLIAGVGLAYHLDRTGWKVVPKEPGDD